MQAKAKICPGLHVKHLAQRNAIAAAVRLTCLVAYFFGAGSMLMAIAST